ncbi:putative ankyrin repeat protein RF_0381 [Mytilus trossulus]|uniref:putative ankyrin repeat protein RF_0381 n=1 Tax=Mytilus trossulus TaxID=6551 RepID=UPI003005B403
MLILQDGETPLILAAEEGHLEVVTYLVTHGSQLDATSSWGRTPLMLAAEEGQLEVVTYLGSNGSQLETTDNYGQTALHYAAENGQIDVIKCLIDQGCSPWVKSKQDTVIKSDLELLVKQSDLKELVTSIVSQLLNTLKDSITAEFNSKLREKTGQLQDNVDSLNLENHLLKEKLREKEIKIKELDEKVEDCNLRSMDALKSANYNEQYSRKHNIRIVNYPEKNNEHLHAEFINLIKKDLKINLKPTDLIAIHHIPGKDGAIL